MSQVSHDTATLNDLIAATFDSVDGYAEAGNQSDNDRLVATFNERGVERLEVINALRSEVVRLGEEPDSDGTLLGSAHRLFLNLKSVVAGQDDKAIIAEIEQGEDHLKAKFEHALADKKLSPQVMHVIRDCFTSIKHGHDQMRDLKQAMNTDQALRV